MTKLLHISASARGESSLSRQAARRRLAQIRQRHPALAVSERDLGSEPPPHPPAALVEASLMPAADRGAAELAALAHSETLIAELEAAEFVLISTPMHNFSVPSALKAWIDQTGRFVARRLERPGCSPTGRYGCSSPVAGRSMKAPRPSAISSRLTCSTC